MMVLELVLPILASLKGEYAAQVVHIMFAMVSQCNDGHTDDRAITVLDRTSKEATFDQILRLSTVKCDFKKRILSK